MTSRRSFLIGTTQVGALALMSPKLIFATPLSQKPVRLLTTGLLGEREFYSVLRACLTEAGQRDVAEVALNAAIFRTPGKLDQTLAALSGTRLVGFIDPWDEMILMQLLRDRGAAVLIEGEHAADRYGVSRHDFVSTPSSAGIGEAMAANLEAGSSPFSISVRTLGSATVKTVKKHREVSTHWATALGIYYADIATGRWDASAAPSRYGNGIIGAERLDRIASSFIADL